MFGTSLCGLEWKVGILQINLEGEVHHFYGTSNEDNMHSTVGDLAACLEWNVEVGTLSHTLGPREVLFPKGVHRRGVDYVRKESFVISFQPSTKLLSHPLTADFGGGTINLTWSSYHLRLFSKNAGAQGLRRG